MLIPESLPPLTFTDRTGNSATFQCEDAIVEVTTKGPVEINTARIRELIRWLADALGETPALAAQPDYFAFRLPDNEEAIIANHEMEACYFCGNQIHPGAMVERIHFPSADLDEPAPPDQFAHDGCRPKSGDVKVTEVEGEPL